MDTLNFDLLAPIKLPLAKKIYKSHYPAAKPKSDERIITAQVGSQLCALVRFRSIENCRLMTGMLVIPDYRLQGVGHKLMQHLVQQELAEQDFCFALAHLETFYCQHGFQTIDKDALPNALKQLFLRYIQGGKSLVAMQYVDPN
ncbi:GNAT family N-acetyltransferase [Vibrio sp. ZSDZ65]|uniref:GNAT family N-acetyltransferase n=1 Tax=Vibrio qingdaonensis TaxID=2829491 RepID=A0A9X3CTF7_9VIBR|nr:GNAT family N-acetyltransferase [Vibrio qingdaonensis]MCW8349216.1 GNAT family N-acetyltransferase [Vibrio qingdaonensis]